MTAIDAIVVILIGTVSNVFAMIAVSYANEFVAKRMRSQAVSRLEKQIGEMEKRWWADEAKTVRRAN